MWPLCRVILWISIILLISSPYLLVNCSNDLEKSSTTTTTTTTAAATSAAVATVAEPNEEGPEPSASSPVVHLVFPSKTIDNSNQIDDQNVASTEQNSHRRSKPTISVILPKPIHSQSSNKPNSPAHNLNKNDNTNEICINSSGELKANKCSNKQNNQQNFPKHNNNQAIDDFHIIINNSADIKGAPKSIENDDTYKPKPKLFQGLKDRNKFYGTEKGLEEHISYKNRELWDVLKTVLERRQKLENEIRNGYDDNDDEDDSRSRSTSSYENYSYEKGRYKDSRTNWCGTEKLNGGLHNKGSKKSKHGDYGSFSYEEDYLSSENDHKSSEVDIANLNRKLAIYIDEQMKKLQKLENESRNDKFNLKKEKHKFKSNYPSSDQYSSNESSSSLRRPLQELEESLERQNEILPPKKENHPSYFRKHFEQGSREQTGHRKSYQSPAGYHSTDSKKPTGGKKPQQNQNIFLSHNTEKPQQNQRSITQFSPRYSTQGSIERRPETRKPSAVQESRFDDHSDPTWNGSIEKKTIPPSTVCSSCNSHIPIYYDIPPYTFSEYYALEDKKPQISKGSTDQTSDEEDDEIIKSEKSNKKSKSEKKCKCKDKGKGKKSSGKRKDKENDDKQDKEKQDSEENSKNEEDEETTNRRKTNKNKKSNKHSMSEQQEKGKSGKKRKSVNKRESDENENNSRSEDEQNDDQDEDSKENDQSKKGKRPKQKGKRRGEVKKTDDKKKSSEDKENSSEEENKSRGNRNTGKGQRRKGRTRSKDRRGRSNESGEDEEEDSLKKRGGKKRRQDLSGEDENKKNKSKGSEERKKGGECDISHESVRKETKKRRKSGQSNEDEDEKNGRKRKGRRRDSKNGAHGMSDEEDEKEKKRRKSGQSDEDGGQNRRRQDRRKRGSEERNKSVEKERKGKKRRRDEESSENGGKSAEKRRRDRSNESDMSNEKPDRKERKRRKSSESYEDNKGSESRKHENRKYKKDERRRSGDKSFEEDKNRSDEKDRRDGRGRRKNKEGERIVDSQKDNRGNEKGRKQDGIEEISKGRRKGRKEELDKRANEREKGYKRGKIVENGDRSEEKEKDERNNKRRKKRSVVFSFANANQWTPTELSTPQQNTYHHQWSENQAPIITTHGDVVTTRTNDPQLEWAEIKKFISEDDDNLCGKIYNVMRYKNRDSYVSNLDTNEDLSSSYEEDKTIIKYSVPIKSKSIRSRKKSSNKSKKPNDYKSKEKSIEIKSCEAGQETSVLNEFYVGILNDQNKMKKPIESNENDKKDTIEQKDKIKTIKKSGIRIPLKLVSDENGKYYLEMDVKYFCRTCNKRREKANEKANDSKQKN